jgi:aminopeptidase YwaD
MIRKLINSALILSLALSLSVFAQQSSQPSVDHLRNTIMYLASDALEGRRTGTQGANDAAHYIAAEFNMLGLRPGMPGGGRTRGENRARYLQPFPYVSKVELGKNNVLTFDPQRRDLPLEIKVGTDWMPLGFSSNGGFQGGETVFAGYGIASTELKYDDYAVSQAKGRVAIAFAGTPDGDNPHGQFTQAGQIRFKAAAARAAGARALLIISDEEVLAHDRLAQLTYDNAGEAGIPVTVISKQTAAWILGDLNALKTVADARTRIGSPPHTGHGLNLIVDVQRQESPSFNVVGILPGSDPKLKSEAIVIGAHYDHLGLGGEGSLAPREGEIHHGADDNASGTAGVLELARMFTQGPKPRRTIVFIAFSGEEEGLIGSNFYVNHPVVPLANTVAMINMDMIGRLKDQKLSIGGVWTAAEWKDGIKRIQDSFTAPQTIPASAGNHSSSTTLASPFSLTLNEDGYGPSDHSSFY